jgi:hypothetical protein
VSDIVDSAPASTVVSGTPVQFYPMINGAKLITRVENLNGIPHNYTRYTSGPEKRIEMPMRYSTL